MKAAVAVADSKVAMAVTGRCDFLDLEQAAAIAEFDDDREAVKELVAAAKDGGFDHLLERLRQNREEEQAKAAMVTELEEQGVTVIDRSETWNGKTKSLRSVDAKLTPSKHKKCPGHAAYVYVTYEHRTGTRGAKAEYVCTDPKKYGHVDRKGQAVEGRDGADPQVQERIAEQARDERRRIIENNKAWRAAANVRREFVKRLVAKKAAPINSSWFVAVWLADPISPASNAIGHRHSVACELLGVEESSSWERKDNDLLKAVHDSGDGRAAVLVLAMSLGSHEAVMGEQVWRRASKHHSRYLNFLADNGYELSEIEQAVIDQPVEVEDDEEFDLARCRVCGCTDEEACDDGCTWVPDPEGLGDICSEW